MKSTWRKIYRVGLILVMLSVLLSAVVPASASNGKGSSQAEQAAALLARLSSAGDNAAQVFGELSAEEQELARLALTPVKEGQDVVSEGPQGPTACSWARVRRWYENVFGHTLVAYFQRIEWCYNGANITSVFRTRWGETYAAFWEFKGHTGNATAGGVGHWSYRAWTQGHFALCLPHVLCAQHKHPWIDMTVRANGTWSWSAGG